ncbi:carboxypeptidase inhibitor SmCI-like [Numenius arquata]|uniref:carboxypeptidase inhibitor SmCI-like n=1 Tax=Numenius arquata TaxID=31919 RepID=UPI003D30D69B
MAAGRFLPLLLLLLSLPTAPSQARPGPDGSALPELCLLLLAVGRCRASVPHWWFNGSAGICQSFVYGGCNGNSNSFPSERECRDVCALSQPQHRSNHVDTSFTEHCAAPRVTGPCRAAFPRWFYSPANGTCQEFIYGGCRGNKNNFQTREECLSRCHPRGGDTGSTGADFLSICLSLKGWILWLILAVPALILVGYMMKAALKSCWDKLELPKVVEPCSHRDDKEYLMKHCAAPWVTGPCWAAFPRWFYSPANGTCQEFIYGGCRGNKNNFQTREECLSRCHP